MMQNIREKFTGWIAITILAVIGVTFIFVGGANFAFIGSNYAAKVDEVEIGLGQFEAAYRDQLQQNPQFVQLHGAVWDTQREAILRNARPPPGTLEVPFYVARSRRHGVAP